MSSPNYCQSCMPFSDIHFRQEWTELNRCQNLVTQEFRQLNDYEVYLTKTSKEWYYLSPMETDKALYRCINLCINLHDCLSLQGWCTHNAVEGFVCEISPTFSTLGRICYPRCTEGERENMMCELGKDKCQVKKDLAVHKLFYAFFTQLEALTCLDLFISCYCISINATDMFQALDK